MKFSDETLKNLQRYSIYEELFRTGNLVSNDSFVLNKTVLKDYQSIILRESRKARTMSTGGSTGEPFIFPVNKWNRIEAKEFIKTGRNKIGFGYGGKTILIWGHSHLLKNKLRIFWRRCADLHQGYIRFSAYALDNNLLLDIWRAIEKHGIQKIIGYSSALELLLDYGILHGKDISRLKCLFTAEVVNVSKHDVYNEYGCELYYEYGSSEFGPIMYGSYKKGYSVLNPRMRVEIIQEELIITDLNTKKEFPFFRYNLGDRVVKEGDKIIGIRGRDYGTLRLMGKVISGELVTHAVKGVVSKSFNVIHKDDFWLVYVEKVTEKEKIGILKNLRVLLGRDMPVEIRTDYRRELTVAGKLKVFIPWSESVRFR